MIGGSALVVQPRSNLTRPSDFIGKRIAVPEYENTQDVSARAWLAAGGVRVSESSDRRGVEVVPTPNSKQLGLFELMQVDAVWTVEPWVSRLELLADGKLLVEEKNWNHDGACIGFEISGFATRPRETICHRSSRIDRLDRQQSGGGATNDN